MKMYNFTNLTKSIIYDKSKFDFEDVLFKYIPDQKWLLIEGIILSYHPKLVLRYQTIRMKNEVKLQKYPFGADFKEKLRFYYLIESKDFSSDVDTIIDDLNLSKDWEYSLRGKIKSDVFHIPMPDKPLSFSFPKRIVDPSYEQKEAKNLRELSSIFEDEDFTESRKRLTNPSIVMTRYVRPKNVNDFLRNEWKKIDPILKKLPKPRFLDVDLNRFCLGVWLFIRKETQNKTWNEIEKTIDLEINRDPDFFGGQDSVPTKGECMKIIDDTKSYFNQVLTL